MPPGTLTMLQQAGGGFVLLAQGGDNSAGIVANRDSCPCRLYLRHQNSCPEPVAESKSQSGRRFPLERAAARARALALSRQLCHRTNQNLA
jgi:hypothetical protein